MMDGVDENPEEGKKKSKGTLAPLQPAARRVHPKFNAARRAKFCEQVARGHDQSTVIRLMKLNISVVNRWIAYGRRTDEDWAREGRTDWFNKTGYKYRLFYLDFEAALAMSEGLVEEVLLESALGYVAEKVIKGKDGAEQVVSVKVPGDFRAADALGKRRERMAVFHDKKRLMRAQADIAEAMAQRQRAEASFAESRAELAARGLTPINGMVYFPAGFIEACGEDERKVIAGAMERLGFVQATEEAVKEAAAQKSEQEINDLEALADRWKDGLRPEDMS
jgi:hypothetical protein